jgi:hypothetical protein
VRISGDSLTIGILGISKSWHIQEWPYHRNNLWIMRLDGETFLRKAEDLMVGRQDSNANPAIMNTEMSCGGC